MGESSESYQDSEIDANRVLTPLDLATTSEAPKSPVASTSSDGGSTSPGNAQRTCCLQQSTSSSRRNRQRVTDMRRTFSPQQLGVAAVKDESFCDCPNTSQNRELSCRCGEEDSGFEWVWDKDSKSAASDLSDDGREVKFHVNYSSGTAAIRGYQPMTDRQHFWEIKMTTPVYGTDIMVGVGTGAVDLDAYRYSFCSLLGKDGESWGFSYFGRTQHKSDFKFIDKGRFGQGSIIGVHLDMWHGALSFYKNRRPLGRAFLGLSGKTLYPIVSSTAARTGIRLIKSCSFSTSLQFLCCQILRKIIPAHLDVTEALSLPPGLQAFLTNNLSWLLRPCELERDRPLIVSSPQKRGREVAELESDSDEDAPDVMLSSVKRVRRNSSDSSPVHDADEERGGGGDSSGASKHTALGGS